MSWELVSQEDSYETRQAADGIAIEKREFRQVVRKMSITAYQNGSEIGNTTGVLTFVWGGTTHTKSLSNPKKYLCVLDGMDRKDIPGNGGERVQRWVYYSPWEETTEFDPA